MTIRDVTSGTERYHPRRLTRSADGRVVAGVAAGLAEHLRVPVLYVRIAFVVLTVFGGAGVVAYGALWFLTPQRADAPDSARPPRKADIREIAALAAISAGAVALAGQSGLGGKYLWPGLAAALGIGLVWQQADAAQRRRWRAVATGGSRWTGMLRLGVGAAFIAIGLTGFLATQGELAKARSGLLSTAVVVAGLLLVGGPWILRLARDLAAERRERIRAQEREEVAAHVHDSVLHTLALIRRNANDAAVVSQLARSQERLLRSWLVHPAGRPQGTVVAALEEVALKVEEEHGVPVETVAVGDAPLDDALQALMHASREAIVNAARSSGADVVSVYAEVESDRVTVFVRDRGCGFDLESVSADRHGIAGSIVGRMRRVGGTASIRTATGEGTEVELAVHRSKQ